MHVFIYVHVCIYMYACVHVCMHECMGAMRVTEPQSCRSSQYQRKNSTSQCGGKLQSGPNLFSGSKNFYDHFPCPQGHRSAGLHDTCQQNRCCCSLHGDAASKSPLSGTSPTRPNKQQHTPTQRTVQMDEKQ